MTGLPGDMCACHHLRFNHVSDGGGEGGWCLIEGCTCAAFHTPEPPRVEDGARGGRE